ncbi:MAG TPA: bifunctional 5,10-methylenetetrahydrofolate dehydrogenase/5,10-methenyltetrahydrofolate cyclohydrolase, partial [Vicinamibacterales bacterium]|nr:bifunctional 5,10-methylenetetrahydrofolate dehydrogenase/5,10-methenyltetrahydrofolate cyclohydrolase [Vicinamibacterales bacterium]
MTARLIDGAAIGAEIRASAVPGVQAFTARAGRAPGLGIVLVGENPASEVYVRNKIKAGTDAGLWVDLQRLPAAASLDELLALVAFLNGSDRHDGILVQSPLPDGMGKHASQRVFDAIDPGKDVDGFHPVNVGRLVQGRAHLKPCTPSGVIEMLDRSGLPIGGRHAVVIGRSEIVGKPMAMLLLQRDATVTICHSKTPGLPAVAAGADILVAAIGRPAFVTRDFVKPGATVIDVGTTPVSDRALVERIFGAGSPRLDTLAKRGTVVVGDVHPEVADVAGALTPVPGGVGPLTIAMLLKNTLAAAEARLGKADSVGAVREP